ncbi:MAG: (deoxy)nucleoside triphosphate pyrophosphohydrolase [Alphaproteobacteria bacterium]
MIVAAAALVRDDGRLLLAQRPEGKAMAGLWEFPGGKVEAGESPQAALSRELREEISIEVAEDDMEAFAFASHAYKRFHLLMPVFLTRRWKGEPTALEGQKLVWTSADEVRNFPTPEADGPLIERYIQWSKAGRA